MGVTDAYGPNRNGIIFSRSIDIAINTTYVILTLINFVGNTAIIFLISRHRQLRTTVNILLLNLSLSDIVGGIGVYPYIFVTNMSSISVNESHLQMICSLTEGLSIFFLASGVGLMTLCAVSFYRYSIIRFPLQAIWTRSKRTVETIIALMWTLSIVFIAPAAISYRYSQDFDVCKRDWRYVNGDVYRGVTLVVVIIIPIAFMFLCYISLRRARRKITFRRHSTACRIKMMKRSEKLVALLIANFVLCWAPFLIYWGMRMFSSQFPDTYDGHTNTLKWVRVTVIFAVVNGSVDPFLLAASSKEIRNKFKKLIFRMLRVGQTSTTVVRFRLKRPARIFTV
ncbi:neuropeptide FF receptor 2-like [Rhopilema esculentum]|uniref:neuropeptide FF receptor 2-like n=1 Tax=Rhopilema esculentum TaxID=499914 RepID=UPI0031E32C7E|eukprot:gene14345-5387_t